MDIISIGLNTVYLLIIYAYIFLYAHNPKEHLTPFSQTIVTPLSSDISLFGVTSLNQRQLQCEVVYLGCGSDRMLGRSAVSENCRLSEYIVVC